MTIHICDVCHPHSQEATLDKEVLVIAKIFMMKRDKEYKDRYQMSWGNKTALGLFRTFVRIAEMIESKEKIKC